MISKIFKSRAHKIDTKILKLKRALNVLWHLSLPAVMKLGKTFQCEVRLSLYIFIIPFCGMFSNILATYSFFLKKATLKIIRQIKNVLSISDSVIYIVANQMVRFAIHRTQSIIRKLMDVLLHVFYFVAGRLKITALRNNHQNTKGDPEQLFGPSWAFLTGDGPSSHNQYH